MSGAAADGPDRQPVRDLGTITAPVLVFGGPYSNLEAAAAMRRRAQELGIPADRVVCTGDVVAYCADPERTVGLIRDWGVHVVMGNCEESLASAAPDCGCGFAEDSTCAVLSESWYRYADAAMSRSARAWMAALPRRLTFRAGGLRFCAVHGAVSAINRFVFPSTPWRDKSCELDAAGVDGILAGHSGIPFTQIEGTRIWHNAGVIGMPANDGTPDGWYSVLVPGERGVALFHHRLVYDAEAAAARMREVGLPEGYPRALTTGLWPSLDVLPDAERRRTGQRLTLSDAL